MNVYRLIADISHLLALVILVVKILMTGSVSGLSGKTQVFYALVFTTRYLDLLTVFISYYNTVMKCAFIFLTYLTVVLIYYKYRSSYDNKNDSHWTLIILIPAALLSCLINHEFSFMEVTWTFSIYLEAVTMIPQTIMLCRTGECETITMHYVFVLGLYRAFYIANWADRYYNEGFYDLVAISGGILQTVIYFPFFYLYFTKARKGRGYRLKGCKGYNEVKQSDPQEVKNKRVSSKVEDVLDSRVDVVVNI